MDLDLHTSKTEMQLNMAAIFMRHWLGIGLCSGCGTTVAEVTTSASRTDESFLFHSLFYSVNMDWEGV